ncbi:MAG: HD domain-containing phosphohydrolase [Pseudomonadota bacterium]
MTEKVLVVDDERNVLEGIRRHLRKRFLIKTALGSKEGLAAVKRNDPYAVIISDLRMPEMDGIQFLSRVRELAPDTVRMMLTGNADMGSAIQAVNEGNIFRFFTKPCPAEVLAKGIQLGIEQYRLVTAERELLQKTLKGSVKVLTEVLSLVNPEAFGRSSRIKRYAKELASHLGLPEVWQFELAAMLSQIGCVILPEKALKKIYHGQDLTEEEKQLFDQHPLIASSLLFNIPRMEKVAEIIRYQEKHFDGSGNPKDNRQGKDIPLGARILKVALDFDMLEQNGITKYKALKQLKVRTGWYDPAILAAVDAILGDEVKYFVKELNVRELQPDMILDEDVYTTKGQLLILRGQEISPLLINRLKNFANTTGIQEPIRALIPVEFSTKTSGK